MPASSSLYEREVERLCLSALTCMHLGGCVPFVMAVKEGKVHQGGGRPWLAFSAYPLVTFLFPSWPTHQSSTHCYHFRCRFAGRA